MQKRIIELPGFINIYGKRSVPAPIGLKGPAVTFLVDMSVKSVEKDKSERGVCVDTDHLT